MPNTSHHGGRRGRSAVVFVVAMVVVAAAAGVGLYVALQHDAEAPPEKIVERPPVVETLSKDECLHLVELRNQGIAYLENERFADAGRVLAELTARLPDDPVGSQNLLITMILSRATTTPVSGDAESLIGRLKQQRPESFVPHVLAARWAKATKNETQAIAELSRAVELADGDLPTLYEFYEETNASRDPALQEKGRTVLRQAREKHPDNLYVLSEWLPVQAGLRDPAIVDSLQAAREMIRPIIAMVAAGPQLGAPEYLEKALDAVSRDDWRQVSQFVAVFRNVIRPTPWVQSDLRRTQRHALGFVVHEFSRLECIETELREPLTVPIGVTLARAPDEQQPPAIPSVKAVRFADFDLDGRMNLLALAEGKVTVLGRKPDEPWSVLAEMDVPAPMSGLIVADLDRDQQDGKQASAAAQAGAPKPADEQQKQAADAIGPCQDADVDLVVFGPAGIRVFRNDLLEDGARKLTPIEQEAAFGEIRDVLAAQFGDFDHDGDLDLMVSAAAGITVWLNRGDLRFYEATSRSTLPPRDVPGGCRLESKLFSRRRRLGCRKRTGGPPRKRRARAIPLAPVLRAAGRTERIGIDRLARSDGERILGSGWKRTGRPAVGDDENGGGHRRGDFRDADFRTRRPAPAVVRSRQ
jgi:hypothetical protein